MIIQSRTLLKQSHKNSLFSPSICKHGENWESSQIVELDWSGSLVCCNKHNSKEYVNMKEQIHWWKKVISHNFMYLSC